MGAWFEIDRDATDLPEAARAEPVLATAPFPGEFDEPERLDPERAQAEPEEPAPLRRRPALAIGMLGSLGLHLLPLLVLLHWNGAPAEMVAPIPVQLVIEEPPAPPAPPPPPPASAEKPPPPGRLASEDIGGTAAPSPDGAAAAPPEETQIAAVPPSPKPAPPPEETQIAAAVPPPPKPAPPPEETQIAALVPPPPKPVPPPKPAVAGPAWHRLDGPREARVPGPAATRDEYLAYLATLTRRHLDMLPPTVVAGRRGETILAILVLGDGTIARIAVAHGSGFPDIDARVEQMVIAVGRFPPLPQWYQASSMELNFRLRFPFTDE